MIHIEAMLRKARIAIDIKAYVQMDDVADAIDAFKNSMDCIAGNYIITQALIKYENEKTD